MESERETACQAALRAAVRTLGCLGAFWLAMGACTTPLPAALDAGATAPEVSEGDVADALEDSKGGPGLPDVSSDGERVDGDAKGADTHADGTDAMGDGTVIRSGQWRSALYPEGWVAGWGPSSGVRLHDFSYAGYRGGAVEPGPPAGAVQFAVTTFGADPTGTLDATAAIQLAIGAAADAGGGVVWFPQGTFRIEGVLEIASSHIVLLGAGSELTRLHLPGVSGFKDHIVFKGTPSEGPDVPLVADGAEFSTEVQVADASGFTVGDDVLVGWEITPEFVEAHQMSEHWQVFNDTWQPFFRRQIVAIDTSATPHRVSLDVPLRYEAKVADEASLRSQTGLLEEVGFGGFGVANAVSWADAWASDQRHVVTMDAVKDAWILDVVSYSSPSAPAEGKGVGAHLQSGGLMVRGSKRVTVADSVLAYPQNRGPGGNGYLFEVRTSSEVLFRDCVGRGGRHNFIQNWGFGATGIVWLRVHSVEGKVEASSTSGLGPVGHSEFHHSLAMANLIDSCVIDDGWSAVNRKDWSSGAGATSTSTVFWNSAGEGKLRSYQHGMGYIIGTGAELTVDAVPEVAPSGISQADWDALAAWEWASPNDWVEGVARGDELEPQSLYLDQLGLRLGR